MSAAATVHGSNNITIQICGDNNTVSLCQRPAVTLWRPPTNRQPTRELEILQSHFQAIPFTGRESILAQVAAWLATPAPISVLTFTGRGGSGKTRLALELFKRHSASCSTGFITAFHPPNALANTPKQKSTKQSLLAVVDYAASHATDLRAFLEDLAQLGSTIPKLRLILLERFADPQSGWYQRLFNYSQTQYTASLFDKRGPVTLVPLSATEDRRAIFEYALDASAPFHPNTQRPTTPTDTLLAKPTFADPLAVMMAALASWDGGIHGDLAVEMARRERTRLEKRSSSILLPHLAAHSTLCGGFDRTTLLDAAREESDALGLSYKNGPGDLASDLAELLPGSKPGGSGSISPDIIGEAFILDMKPEGISRAARRNGEAVFRTLTRALQDFFDPYKVRGEERSGVDSSQTVTWIRSLANEAKAGDINLLEAISLGLPESSLELGPLSAEVEGKLLSQSPKANGASQETLAERARLLSNYGNRLSAIGQWQAALEAAGEATVIYRQLAAASQDEFLPYQAMSLNNYATMLGEVGQQEAALSAARQAVLIYRQLAEARPDTFRPDLATSLTSYAAKLSHIGQRVEALETSGEAVLIYRQLAIQRPDTSLSGLATALNNHVNILNEVGQRGAAFEAAREALDIRRKLATANPDAFLPDLAVSLNNYGVMLRESGQQESVMDAMREAVEIRRQLAASRPDAFLPSLATSLNNYGNWLGEIGEREAALDAVREAVELRRRLSSSRPDAFLPDLATSLGDYALRLKDVGQTEAALVAAQEASVTYRQLATTRPDAFLPKLATSLAAEATIIADPVAATTLLQEALTVLLPQFLKLPIAHCQLISSIVSHYLKQCDDSRIQPDSELLTKILQVLEKLNPETPQGEQDPS